MRAVKKPAVEKVVAAKPVAKKTASKRVSQNASATTAELIRGLRKDVEMLSANADRLLDRLHNL